MYRIEVVTLKSTPPFRGHLFHDLIFWTKGLGPLVPFTGRQMLILSKFKLEIDSALTTVNHLIQLLCTKWRFIWHFDYDKRTECKDNPLMITLRLFISKDNSIKVVSTPLIMVKILGIKFAPLLVPLERRLQTFFIFLLVGIVGFFPFVCCFLILYLLFFTNLYFISIVYIAWMLFDINILKTS